MSSENIMKIPGERSEQVADLIDRMPVKFGYWVTGIVIGLFALLLSCGFLIDYPDTVTGSIEIKTQKSPLKLVANASGKLLLMNHRPKIQVTSDAIIAVIENPAKLEDVLTIKSKLSAFNINEKGYYNYLNKLPTKLSLGDISSKYYTFLNALQKVYDYKTHDFFEKQEAGLKKQQEELNSILEKNHQLRDTKGKNLAVAKNMFERDSTLFSEKVLTQADEEATKAAFLTSKESYQNIEAEIGNTKERLADSENQLQQLYLQQANQENEMRLDIIAALDDLNAAIQLWELHFVFKAPISGSVEFSKFWSNNDFINAGEDAFTIVPNETIITGQMRMPTKGAGKVHVGNSVIIKLDNYPFEEYGSIKGRVRAISTISHTVKASGQSDIDTYLVDVDVPAILKTNYGTKLNTNSDVKGSADIVTDQRSLIARFFDNLHHVSSE